jgi:ornithine cyclodeaminase/alanine dehydrogenase-like protein (mu-crystallin family)
MALILSESEVLGLLSMKDVVRAVEECFRAQGISKALNSPRSRSVVPGSRLNVMHASLSYLGRSGTKVYLSTKTGTRYLVLLFDNRSGDLLSVMGADFLGRFRTGAASAVATKYLCGLKSFRLALAGSGRQALTQVLALREVAKLEHVSIWSPTKQSRDVFARDLSKQYDIEASAVGSAEQAFQDGEVGTTITSSTTPFLTGEAVRSIEHLNLCGTNQPAHSEVTPQAISLFNTVCVDDISQSKSEAGDLVIAASQGALSWEKVQELKDFVASVRKPRGKTLFKSNGVAIEDVATASLVYDNAMKSPEKYKSAFNFWK